MDETTNRKQHDLVDQIIAYESGDLGDADTLALFQELVNTGMAWKLQGHYGRTAQHLLKAKLIQPAQKETQ